MNRILTVLLVLVAILACGCQADHRKVIGPDPNAYAPPEFGGPDNPLPTDELCDALKAQFPGFECHFVWGGILWGARPVDIDGHVVWDTIIVVVDETSERESNYSASASEDLNPSVACPNPDIVLCKGKWVWNLPEGRYEWQITCRSYACLAWSPE